MCCFSQPVEKVAETQIFVRSVDDRQLLVYSMSYAAVDDLAMVLPLPVPANLPDDGVAFINLATYADFFSDLNRGFPIPQPPFDPSRSTAALGLPALKVHEVGDFEASFVPRMKDFDRLDKRFRIKPSVWQQIPLYHDYGFAVFKLKGSRERRGRWSKFMRGRFSSSAKPPQLKRVHPMAFSFPRRDSRQLFFPTIHIHDGEVHEDAEFDHVLYCQVPDSQRQSVVDWRQSTASVGEFIDETRAAGVVDPAQPCWRLPLQGRFNNSDATVGDDGMLPQRLAGGERPGTSPPAVPHPSNPNTGKRRRENT